MEVKLVYPDGAVSFEFIDEEDFFAEGDDYEGYTVGELEQTDGIDEEGDPCDYVVRLKLE